MMGQFLCQHGKQSWEGKNMPLPQNIHNSTKYTTLRNFQQSIPFGTAIDSHKQISVTNPILHNH